MESSAILFMIYFLGVYRRRWWWSYIYLNFVERRHIKKNPFIEIVIESIFLYPFLSKCNDCILVQIKAIIFQTVFFTKDWRNSLTIEDWNRGLWRRDGSSFYLPLTQTAFFPTYLSFGQFSPTGSISIMNLQTRWIFYRVYIKVDGDRKEVRF